LRRSGRHQKAAAFAGYGDDQANELLMDRSMSDRFKPRAMAIAAAAFLLALGGVCAAATLHPQKDHLPKAPLKAEPPPVHFIRCATVLGDSPCSPDPAMQRLNGEPRIEGPYAVPDGPDFSPAR
jgi:hypothetical protein